MFDINILANTDCACKSYIFDINILEKLLEDATSDKRFEKPTFNKKGLNKNKYSSNNKNNKIT